MGDIIRFGSVCSGIEAASAAWLPLGFRCSFMSEIEPSARAVLKHHYGDTPLHGDFTTIQQGDYEPIDVLVGGTPCQSFSVAGLRGGLSDDRGNLALEYLRLAERLQPGLIIWENVPGVLSSVSHDAPDPCQPPDDLEEGSEWVGEDEYDADESHAFACFLAGLSALGYGWAYRIFDAQYFQLAQRRERVFVVGCLGGWADPSEILSLREGLRGYPAPRRATGERVAGGAAGCVGGGVANPLGSKRDGGWRGDLDNDTYVSDSVRSHPRPGSNSLGNIVMALNAHGGSGRVDGESETFVTFALGSHAGAADGDQTNRSHANGGPVGSGISEELSHNLRSGRPQTIASAYRTSGNCGAWDTGDRVDALNTGTDPSSHLIAHSLRGDGFDASEDGTGRGTPLVACGAFDTLYDEGINQWETDASTHQTDTGTLLLRVREEIGKEAFAEWGFGILNSLLPAEVLRSALHGTEFRQTAFSQCRMVGCACDGSISCPERIVQSLREVCGERCPSHGWESLEQLAGKLGAYLSELSQPGTQVERLMHDLWQADEGPWLLRKTLSKVQEAWRSFVGKSKSTHATGDVRRLTPKECQRLMGFPDNYFDGVLYRGKPLADGNKYRLLGNSMAVPVMAHIGRKIELAYRKSP